MKKNIFTYGIVLSSALIVLTACSSGSDTTTTTTSSTTTSTTTTATTSISTSSTSTHGEHSGEIPNGMQNAANPAFPVGSTISVTADHVNGGKVTKATVVKAFDTTALQVNYTPTDGGSPVIDHKWVVLEELKNQTAPPKVGDTVTLEASHLPGMQGVEAEVTGLYEGVVYVIDFEDDHGMEMKNHLWISEDEAQSDSE
ncbi:hypothetical protein FACS189418_7280 [Clostridia bacterium]|nr:hypothetical protein FACS189418_7280 [Clostridia bacterium]